MAPQPGKIVLLTSARHYLSHLFLPVGVQHLIGLIDDGVSASYEQKLPQTKGRHTGRE